MALSFQILGILLIKSKIQNDAKTPIMALFIQNYIQIKFVMEIRGVASL